MYEDFFYSSASHENAAETVRFFGESALYTRSSTGEKTISRGVYVSSTGEKTISRGVYVFFQSREELFDDFIDQNRADLESFCFHKNIEIKPDQAVFRTVFEDGQTAYQLWIPLKTD